MNRRRPGFAIMLVIVLLSIVSVTLAYATTSTVAQRHALHQRERRMQARWLLRSGFDRSLARLQDKSADFQAEWKDLAPDSRIHAKVAPDGKDQFRVTIEANAGVGKQEPVNLIESWTLKRVEAAGRVRFELVNGT